MSIIAAATDSAKANHTDTPFSGVLFVDLEGQRARYECLRPSCPNRRVGPVTAMQDGLDTVIGFITDVKIQHVAQHHPGDQ